MEKPKFIKEIEKFEWKERAKCWKWFIRVYWKLDNKPMVELESLQILIKELHKLEEENRNLKEENRMLKEERIFSLWEWDYMILTSTTPQLKLTKKDNSDLYSNITIWTTKK